MECWERMIKAIDGLYLSSTAAVFSYTRSDGFNQETWANFWRCSNPLELSKGPGTVP